ncbi:hypothetical protein ACF0H5_009062 [Mactra antiquata]
MLTHINIVLCGLLFMSQIIGIRGSCNINACVSSSSNLFIQTCKEYTDTMRCMKTKYDSCVGKATTTEIFTSTQAMQRPTDCQLDMTQFTTSMTVRNDMMTSMWSKQPAGSILNPWSILGGTDTTGTDTNMMIPPLGMMGGMDDGPFDDGPFDDGPFDDGPFDDGPFDDGPFGGMHPALMPGLLNTNTNTVSGSTGVTGAKRSAGTARQIDDADKNLAEKLTVSTILLVLLPISLFINF